MAGMPTGRRRIALLLALLLAPLAPLASAAQPTPDAADHRVRVDAFFAALASGRPDTFEAMARGHFTPASLARRTSEERAELVRRLREDFGTMTLEAVRPTGSGVELEISGSTGMRGLGALDFEPGGSRRIDRFGIRVEAGRGEEGPALPPPPVARDSSDAEFDAALTAYLAARASAGEFSGAVLVARAGRATVARAVGDADRATRVANAPATRFNIGSINKSFTQLAVAQLMAAGRLAPTDTIGTLLPDYPNADARSATIQHLLDHRGGIADIFGPVFAATPKATLRANADYYRLVAPQPLTFAPGTNRAYCNGCYVVLGEIIARVTGQSYESYIAEHIFAPARMSRTTFVVPDASPGDMAYGYTTRGGSDPTPRRNSDMVGAGGSAAGGAWSTVADLLAYVEALRTHRLLGREPSLRLLGAAGTADRLTLAGGAPGLNAVIHASGDIVVVVLANLDPPHAERLGEALARQLTR